MQDTELEKMLAKIVELAKDNALLRRRTESQQAQIAALEPKANSAEQCRLWLESARKDERVARARVLDWEKYDTAVRDLVPISKRANWPKAPDSFDDIPF